ncbi:MAG: hypothetical protein QM660_14340 [Dysgonomonas sp.]
MNQCAVTVYALLLIIKEFSRPLPSVVAATLAIDSASLVALPKKLVATFLFLLVGSIYFSELFATWTYGEIE